MTITLGQGLYEALVEIHGEFTYPWDKLNNTEKAPWEAEGVRLVIRDTPDSSIAKACDDLRERIDG